MNDDSFVPRLKPRVLFVALANDVGNERVIMEMMKYDVACAAMSAPGFNCMTLTGLTQRFPLPGHFGVKLGLLRVRQYLHNALNDWEPGLILPLDDSSAWLLRSLAVDRLTSPTLRDVLIRSLGAPSGYPATVGRFEFMNQAETLDVRKPRHCAVSDSAAALSIAGDWGYPVVVKAEHTAGGVGVAVVHTPQELAAHLRRHGTRRLSQKLRQASKRQLYRLAGFQPWNQANMILQSYVAGIPAFRTVAAWRGRVLAGLSLAAEQIHPEPTGAATVVRKIENAEMETAAARVTAALGCSGFVSYDFILNERDGHASIVEMNARSVGTTHLGRLFGSDVCGALAERLTGETISHEPAAYQVAALFPKEISRDAESPYLSAQDVYHDVPGGEPALLRAYLHQFEKAGIGSTHLPEIIHLAETDPAPQQNLFAPDL